MGIDRSKEYSGKKRRGLTTALAGVVVAAGAVGLMLAVGEVAVRLAGYRPPELVATEVKGTYRFEPGARFTYVGFRPGSPVEFRTPIVLNKFGFHDRDYDETRPDPRTYRVMVLGDSYVAALEVENRQAFHKLLEKRLNAEDPLGRGTYEVIAFGQGNRAQEAQLGWLRAYGPRYRPDLVLLVFFCGNDVMENSPVTYGRARAFGDFYLQVIAPRKIALYNRLFVVRGSRLNGFVAERAATFYSMNMNLFHRDVSREQLGGPDVDVYRTPPAPEWQDAWRRTASLLGEVRREAASQGSGYAMAVISGPQAIAEAGQERLRGARTPGMDLAQPDRWVSQWCGDNGVASLSLAKALSAADPRLVFWRYDAHLTPFGHQIAADALYPFLVARMSQGVEK